MTDAVHPSIGDLLPRPSRSALIGGGLVAVLGIILLDGGIAAWAQMTVRDLLAAEQTAFFGYSITKHVAAMIALSLYTVGIAVALIRAKQPLLAAVLVAGVAAGPMSIVAAPVNESVLGPDRDPTWWWQVLVQGGQLVILLGWTWWTSRCIQGKRIIVADPMQADQTHGAVSSVLLFSLYTAVTLTAQILTRTANGIGSPGLLAMAGWAMLGAGGAVIVIQSSFWPMSGIVFTSGVLMLGMLYSAYFRPGGWPGVAGWENGTSPMILSMGISFCVLAGPLIGAALRRRHPPAGAVVEAPAEESISSI